MPGRWVNGWVSTYWVDGAGGLGVGGLVVECWVSGQEDG